MLVLSGSVPVDKLPILIGPIDITPNGIKIDGQELGINRGNEAMMTAACLICQEYGVDKPVGLVAGDIGKRDGSEAVYHYLADHLHEMDVDVMTMHYIMPDIKLNKKMLEAVAAMKKKPVLIADAGTMYVTKAGGDAHFYDVFTPDLGEMAFLADDKADHPAFTRGFIFELESDVPELIRRSYESKNAPSTMFVKGRIDYICQDGEIVETISEPCIHTMEPIGGTGDLITGMISGLIYAGLEPLEACSIAGNVNRKAGELSKPTPATQIAEILQFIPEALNEVQKQRG